MLEISDNTWQNLIYNSDAPVLILYTLGKDLEPCITMEKKLDEILKKDLRLMGYFYDLSKNYRYNFAKHVSGIPTLIGIKNKKVVLSANRVMTNNSIKEFIEKLLNSSSKEF